MPTTHDAASQSKRPSLGRHTSASSYVSQSPSDGTAHSSSYKGRGPKPQKHVVGKLGRNVSFGKNLDKLNSNANLTAIQAETAENKLHKRSKSGDASAPSSPARPALVKRNTSTAHMKRNTSHTALRKNLSSGHLPRHGSGKNLAKHGRTDAPRMKRSSSDKGKASRQSQSPPPKPVQSVRFDVGDEDEDDDEEGDGWTEDSASQSPETTRTNTRANSVIGEVQHAVDGSQDSEPRPPHRREPSDPVVRFAPTSTSPPRSAQRHSISESPVASRDYADDVQQINGHSSYVSSARHPDVDAITSRLLQRAPNHGAAPQTTMVSAEVHADSQNPRLLSHSQGSMLQSGSADTPGSRDLVSRFVNGSGSGGNTPSSSFLPHKQRPTDFDVELKGEGEITTPVKRNKSTPNMAHPLSAAASVAAHKRSGSGGGRPSPTIPDPEAPLSRTQQKLMLQRASSTIEPAKMIPSVLPRTSGPALLGPGINYTADSDGRLDPRLQRQFDQVQLEYRAIRRYRNPLAEAIKKLGQCKGPRKDWTSTSAASPGQTPSTAPSLRPLGTQREGTRTPASGLHSGVHSSRASVAGSTRNSGAATPARAPVDHEGERVETKGHKSRVSFEMPEAAMNDGEEADEDDTEEEEEDDDDDDEQSIASSVERPSPHHDDAYEICRRLWDMPAAGEGG